MRRIALLLAATLLPVAVSAQAKPAKPVKPIEPKTYTTPAVGGTRWSVDPAHSEVGFRIRHLVGRVRGRFTEWNGTIVTKDQDWTHGTVNVNVKTRSIDTGNPARDADLRSARFFSVDSFPTMAFESTGIIAEKDKVEIGGLLTIKGKTKHVTLKGAYRGIGKDEAGRERIAFDGTTVVDRREFGLTWNKAVEKGAMIGDVVEIELAIEAVRSN